METLKNLFWNRDENRIRSGFRMVATLILYLILNKGYLALLNGLGAMLIYSSTTPLYIFILSGTLRIFPAVLALWIIGRYVDKRPFKNFGFHLNKKWWADFSKGFLFGAALMAIIFITELAFGWVTTETTFYTSESNSSFIAALIVFIFAFFCAGMAEEIFSRGYLITNLAEGFKTKSRSVKNSVLMALFATSILFGLMHLGNSNATILSTFNIMLAGVMFGVAYIYTGELAIPIGLHLSWNFFQANIFGLPVSGITYPAGAVTLIKTVQNGPDFLTGGKFGPEGGLLGSLVFIIGIIIIYYWLRSKDGATINAFHDRITNY